ncbi:hypothetical protein GCM10019016_002780 [Streptomyces prasinosporus]|uniref:Uncharacterized protein n=1 Tax=Streptomyces prasinosporus TaxID=68256 RepID=A0ABP6TEC8_9ACTN
MRTTTASRGASLHTATTVTPGPGDRPQQGPDLVPLGGRELQVGVVHPEEPGPSEQGQRERQPQRLHPLQVPHGGPRALGQCREVQPGGGQRGVDVPPPPGPALAARTQQRAQGITEAVLQQRPFAQVLADGQGRVEVGHAR